MDWKFPKFKAGQPRRWEFLLPPGSAKETESVLAGIISDPFLPRNHTPEFKVFPEKFILEKTNFRQALEVLVRVPWARDFRLNLGKFPFTQKFSFSGLLEKLKESGLLPPGWEVNFHPQVRGRTDVSREELQSLWEESYSEPSENNPKRTELNALALGEDLILSLSLAGSPLFKRGNFKPLSKSAPVREDTAVFLLHLLEKKMSNPDAVFVPFAGSGTFIWESSSLIHRIGFPHLDRNYMFQDLEDFPGPSWDFLRKKIISMGKTGSLRIWFNDSEPEVFSYLKERNEEYQDFLNNLEPEKEINVQGSEGDFFSFSSKDVWEKTGKPGKIWMPLNPPYGLRIQNGSNSGLYRKIAEVLKDWWELPTEISGFVLCPDEESWSSFLKGVHSKLHTVHITHGGLDLRVVYF
ncbi:hypothetical protein [Leptospira sarikeiensis]|uniref:Uncharacterized protein n=1 Tax=Leptospira sarikeiensis TaxID=2484943 RepID=A0A4R9K5J7_9LEPT|nr:hypothetical protein [Leptospira sarikeiensis]TGL60818.1 hypothetical protein EHQ64_13475 [Leptospira sarikeiensis]